MVLGVTATVSRHRDRLSSRSRVEARHGTRALVRRVVADSEDNAARTACCHGRGDNGRCASRCLEVPACCVVACRSDNACCDSRCGDLGDKEDCRCRCARSSDNHSCGARCDDVYSESVRVAGMNGGEYERSAAQVRSASPSAVSRRRRAPWRSWARAAKSSVARGSEPVVEQRGSRSSVASPPRGLIALRSLRLLSARHREVVTQRAVHGGHGALRVRGVQRPVSHRG